MTTLLPQPEPPDPVEGALGHFDHSNWVKASLHALDAGTMRNTGGAVDGDMSVNGALLVNDDASEQADIFLTGNGNRSVWGESATRASRWRMILGDSTAESGSDSGALFALIAYGDTGTARVALAGSRVTGLLTVAGSPTAAKGIATKEYADAVVPIGSIIAFGGPSTKIPAGWHICDGSAHGSQALLDLTGSVNTPDLRARFIVGVSPAYPLGAVGGAETVVLTQAQTPVKSHTHPIDHAHATGSTGAEAGHTHTMNHDHPQFNTPNYVHSHTLSIREGTGEGDGYYLDTNPTDSGVVKTLSGSKTADNTHAHTINVPAFTGSTGAGSSHSHSASVPAYQGSSGAASSDIAIGHENRPPYYALIYIIKKG